MNIRKIMAPATASAKAAENLFPREVRLYEDPIAERFVTPLMRIILRIMKNPKMFESMMALREKMSPGVMGSLFCRTRYIDDLLNRAAAEGFTSFVNLGAGYDTRTFRFDFLKKANFYEVDLPPVLKGKKKIADKKLGGVPPFVKFVPIDFDAQDLETELKKAGYNRDEKTLFIMEGVTQYILPEANESNFRYIAGCAEGGKVAFTYILESFIKGTSHQEKKWAAMRKQMLKQGKPLWVTGYSQERIRNILDKYGFQVIEDIGREDYIERYMKPNNRETPVMDLERMLLAEVKTGK